MSTLAPVPPVVEPQEVQTPWLPLDPQVHEMWGCKVLRAIHEADLLDSRCELAQERAHSCVSVPAQHAHIIAIREL
eukprot:1317336-Alexandrium_andersonii.AAC.1